MKSSKFFAAFVVLSVLAGASGCSQSRPAGRGAVDADAQAKALMRLDDEWSAAAGTRDAAKVAAFYADDCVAYPANEPVARGKAAAQKVWAAYFTDPSFNISWKADDARVSGCGGLGYTAGTYSAFINTPGGRKVTERGKFVCVWKKQPDGTWKAFRDIWNSDAK